VTAPGPTLDVSIVVPTFREAENLQRLIPLIDAAMAPTGQTWELIIVDDDSRDGTPDVVARYVAAGLPVRLITRVGERGLSSAVLRGFSEARGRRLVCMDADLSHPPAALPRLLAALNEPDVEFVIGSRYVPGAHLDPHWGLFRRLNSWVATLLARPFASVRDPLSGYFALPRTVYARAAPLNPVGYKIALELIVKCNCRAVREVPIEFLDRQRGPSKLSLGEQLRYLQHLVRLADYQYGTKARLVRFGGVGVAGVLVDLALYAAQLGLGAPLASARAVAIAAAMLWNASLHRYCAPEGPQTRSRLRYYTWYLAACLPGALVSWSTAMAARHWSPLADHVYLAALLGIGAGTIPNGVLLLRWLFGRRSGSRP